MNNDFLIDKKELLFRENTMFTKSMSAYAIMVGTGYLQETLFEPMQKLSGLAEIQAPEFDPEESDENNIAMSKDVLQLMSRLIFTALGKSLPRVPTQLHIICNLIKTAVTKKFPDEDALQIALGGFYFLRLLGPVIIHPDSYGLMKNAPDANVRKAEIMVSKVMMAIVNGVLFGETMQILNDFVESQRESLQQLLQDLAAFDVNISPPDPIDIPLNVTQVSLAYVYNQIVQNIDQIRLRLMFAPPAPPHGYECPPALIIFLHTYHPPPPEPEQKVDDTSVLVVDDDDVIDLDDRRVHHHTSLIVTPSGAASSSAPKVPASQAECEKYTQLLIELQRISDDERAAKKRVFESLEDLIQRCGTEPFKIEKRRKDKGV